MQSGLRWCLGLLVLAAMAAGCETSPPPIPDVVRQRARELSRDAVRPTTNLDFTISAPAPDPRVSIPLHEEWSIQETAADALRRIGEPAVPDLINSLRNPDPDVRYQAVDILARIGPAARAAVPELIRTLDDPDERVRKSAVRALGQIGPAAQQAVPDLLKLLREPTADQPN